MDKGNIVTSNNNGKEGLILAVTKDGKRAKVYVLGSDGVEVWKDKGDITVTISGDEQCWKCGGSGLFYMGGMVLNGTYTGKTGECYGCGGKGTQNNADRVRNHHYWHREHSVWMALDAIERGEQPEPLSRPLVVTRHDPEPDPEPVSKPAKVKIRSKKKADSNTVTKSTEFKHEDSTLTNCKDCGCLHRLDVDCPW